LSSLYAAVTVTMANLILFITLFFGLQQYSEAIECKEFCSDKFKNVLEGEVLTSCEKGCNYYENLASLDPNCGPRKSCCENGCDVRFPTNGVLSQSCFRGCMFTQTPQEATEEDEGMLGQLFMIVRKFYYDQATGRGITLTEVYKFGESNDDAGPLNEEQELKTPEQLLEKALTSRGQDTSFPDSRPRTATVIESHSYTDYSALFDFLLLLAMAAVSLLGLVYIFVMVRGRRAALANQKAANLAVAVQHEPIKLIRPEDLTKLSLIDDDEAPPLPEKGDLGLPQSTV